MNERAQAPLMMDIAERMSLQSTCTRVRRVGAVLVSSEGYIVSTGYNGAPHGVQHCDEVEAGCLLGEDGSCMRAVHAEMNCILQCARRGTSSMGTSLYSTHFPCPACAQAIVQAGIVRLVWDKTYKDKVKLAAAEQILREGGITLTHISEILEALYED
jgi:dCMP deaminase